MRPIDYVVWWSACAQFVHAVLSFHTAPLHLPPHKCQTHSVPLEDCYCYWFLSFISRLKWGCHDLIPSSINASHTYASIKPLLLSGNVVRFYQPAYGLPISALNLGLQDIPPLLMYFMQRYYTWTRMGLSPSNTTTQIFTDREKQMWFSNTGLKRKKIRNEHSVFKTSPHVVPSIHPSIYLSIQHKVDMC